MLPAILAAARTIGIDTLASSAVRSVGVSGKLGEIATKIKRDVPGEIWRRAGGDQVPIADKIFNRWNDKRIERIDRYKEIKETRAARAHQQDRVMFEREQKHDQVKQQKLQEKIIQKEEAAQKAEDHAAAHMRAVVASQGDTGNSFLERISIDISQLKEYIFKYGIGGEGKQTPQAGGGLLSGILSALSLGIPAFGGRVMGGLGRGVSAIRNIGGKAIDLVKVGSSKVIDAARSVAPRIGTLAESVGGVAKNAFRGIPNVISRGSGILTSAGEAAAGMLKGGGAIGRIAGVVGRLSGPVAAGLAGWEAGKWLNEKMEGTDIGKAKDRIFNSIFSGVDKLTGGAISGSKDVADQSWKESSLGKFVEGTKGKVATAAGKALSVIIPSASAQTIPVAGPGTIAMPGQVAVPSAFSPDQKADEIRIKAEQQKFQRLEQQRFDQTQKTNQALIGSIDANTKATVDTIEPLKTISSPDWLQNLAGQLSNAGSWVRQRISDAGNAIKNSSVGQAATKAYEAVKKSEVGQAAARTYEGVKDWVLGSTSKRFESGRGGAGTISSGRGDLGGKSYGTYQMTGDALKNFVLKGKYADQFKGLELKSDAFDAKWKELAATDPEFGKAQHDFIKQSHFDPQQAHLQKSGIDLSKRGAAVQDAIWSTSVQFGAKTDLIKKALDGKDISKMSDADIVSAIQDYKIKNNESLFRSSSDGVRAGTLNRAMEEKAALIKLASDPELAKVGEKSTVQVASAQGATSNKIGAAQQSGATKLGSATQTNVGDIVGEQTIQTKKAEQLAAQPVVIATGGSSSVPAPAPQSSTTNTGSAPMVTRNQDSSIRRVTDAMMSYGLT